MKRRKMKRFVIGEVSAVDVPAQAHALATIAKRQTVVKMRVVLTSETDGHAHAVYLDDPHGKAGGDGGTTSYHAGPGGQAHCHPWARQLDGSIVVGAAEGHNHAVDAGVFKNSVGDDEPLPVVAASAEPHQEIDMSDELKKLNDELALAKRKIDDLDSQLRIAKRMAELSDEEKAYARGLPETERGSFIEKGQLGRREEIEKARAADPVEYTTDDGAEIRKSAGPLVLALAKQNDAARRELAKVNAEREALELAKRASDLMGNSPGTEEAKAALAKAIGTIPEPLRGSVEEIIKAGNNAIAGGARSMGVSGARTVKKNDNDPEAQLESLAKAYEKANGVSFAKAYASVMDTDEGRALYAQLDGMRRSAH